MSIEQLRDRCRMIIAGMREDESDSAVEILDQTLAVVAGLEAALKEHIDSKPQDTEPEPIGCPWCGWMGGIQTFFNEFAVACVKADCPFEVSTKKYPTIREAVEAWNTRAEVQS